MEIPRCQSNYNTLIDTDIADWAIKSSLIMGQASTSDLLPYNGHNGERFEVTMYEGVRHLRPGSPAPAYT